MVRPALTLALVALAIPVAAQEPYRDARIRYLEPGVTLQGAEEAEAEEAVVNLPFLPGDRVWTDGSGRIELQFADGTLLRLDAATKLDFVAHSEESGQETVVLRLWSGSLQLVVLTVAGEPVFVVETPGGAARLRERGSYRVDAYGAETWLTVFEGSGMLESFLGQTYVAAGQRAYVAGGEEPEEAERFDPYDRDDFAQWNAARDGRYAWAAGSRQYIPDEIGPYAADLDDYGTWYHDSDIGYVWQPHVGVDWQPYTNGRWVWTSYGWTWVAYEPWGWAPFHYGRWGFTVSLGWHWIPGRTWGPAWVSWAIGPRYVGWCPLDRWDRPARWHSHRPRRRHERAVPRSSVAQAGWHYVERAHLRSHDIAGRRVRVRDADVRALDPGRGRLDRRLEVADRARLRSTADRTPRTGHGQRPDPFSTIRARAGRDGTSRPSTRQRGGSLSELRSSRSDRGASASPRRDGQLRKPAAERDVLGGFFRRLTRDGTTTSHRPPRSRYAPRTSRPLSGAVGTRSVVRGNRSRSLGGSSALRRSGGSRSSTSSSRPSSRLSPLRSPPRSGSLGASPSSSSSRPATRSRSGSSAPTRSLSPRSSSPSSPPRTRSSRGRARLRRDKE
jgi:hypothetical protein